MVRSTNVPIAELWSPRIRSPSQCPGTARSVASAGRAADQRFWRDELLVSAGGAGPGHAERTPVPQARNQLAPKRAPALDVKRLINGLVGDPHRLIIGEIEPNGTRSATGLHAFAQTAILSAPMAASDPRDLRDRARPSHLAH